MKSNQNQAPVRRQPQKAGDRPRSRSGKIDRARAKHAISEEEARAQIAAAFRNRGQQQPSPSARKAPSRTRQNQDDDSSEQEERRPKTQMAEQQKRLPQTNRNGGYAPPSEVGGDDISVASSLGSIASYSQQANASSSRKPGMSSRKLSGKLAKPNAASRQMSNVSLLGDSGLLNKEALIADAIEEDSPIQEPIFDSSAKKAMEAEARAKERRRKKKMSSRKKNSVVSSAISVYTSPSDLDMNIAAFEHEWRDGLWDIFAHGVCHPHLFVSFYAPICKYSQSSLFSMISLQNTFKIQIYSLMLFISLTDSCSRPSHDSFKIELGWRLKHRKGHC